MDNGQVEGFIGYRVHTTFRAACKGHSLHPNVTLDEVRRWRMDDLEDRHRERSVCGAKGGVICDPEAHVKSELNA